MKSKLSTDILRHRDRSPFMRSEPGVFALREWSGGIQEFHADRHQPALFDEDIVVFPRESLSKYVPGRGLFSSSTDSRDLGLELRPMRRREAEDDTTVIQLVSVFIVRSDRDILTYKRSKRLPESRLHGFYSLSFGGHLNPDDVGTLLNIFDPEQAFAMLERELGEELRLDRHTSRSFTYRGLLYDDSRSVSQQHLGIVYEVTVSSKSFVIGERGFLMDPKYESVEQIRERLADFENWSVLLIETLGHLWH
jgi:predicted NUDIX family phosphoesterase